MASRRMFSQRIVSSARFLKMSPSAQSLYFHFGMRADDDGIVEAFPIMQMLGAAEDDFRVLVAKGFVRLLNDDMVSFILDWNEHNIIRADRKVDSIYKDLLLQVVPDAELVIPAPRSDVQDNSKRLDGPRTAQVRLGKDSINTSVAIAPQIEIVATTENAMVREKKDTAYYQVYELFKNPWPLSWKSNRTQIQSAKNLLEERGLTDIKDALEWYEGVKNREFCPVVTSPYDLDSKWDKLEAFNDKKS